MNARFLQVDVFTAHPFEGNQLAVFHDADAIPEPLLQVLTREMNFAESTFVFSNPRAGTDARMRIFTPEEELPMAGHPTIGTTFALASLGRIRAPQPALIYDLKIGPIRVELAWRDDGALDFAWMDQPVPSFGDPLAAGARADAAQALGLAVDDLLDVPVQVVSWGMPFYFVGLRDEAAVDRSSLDRNGWAALCRGAGHDRTLPVFIFAMSPREGVTCYSRMFAPELGIPEDPATGGASGPLGCFMLRHGLVDGAGARAMLSLQGVRMKRPSRIHIRIAADADGTVERVQVGGQSVVVGDGEIRS